LFNWRWLHFGSCLTTKSAQKLQFLHPFPVNDKQSYIITMIVIENDTKINLVTLVLLKIVWEKCIYFKRLCAMHKTRHLSKLRVSECTMFNTFLNNFHNTVLKIQYRNCTPIIDYKMWRSLCFYTNPVPDFRE